MSISFLFSRIVVMFLLMTIWNIVIKLVRMLVVLLARVLRKLFYVVM